MNKHRKSSSINPPVLQQGKIKKVIQLQNNFNNGASQQQIRNFIQIQDSHHLTENQTNQGKGGTPVFKAKHHGKKRSGVIR